MPDLYTGQLEGTLTVPINASTGLATFSDLRVTTKGRYYLKLVAVSTPAGYTMEVITGLVDARPAGWVQPVVEVSKIIKLRFNIDYNSTLSNGRSVYILIHCYLSRLANVRYCEPYQCGYALVLPQCNV